MPIYESKGKKYNIPDNRVNDFIKSRSDAKLVDSTPYYLSKANSTGRQSIIQNQTDTQVEETPLQKPITPVNYNFSALPETEQPVRTIQPFGKGKPLTEAVGGVMKGMPISNEAAFDMSIDNYKYDQGWIKSVQNNPGISAEVKQALADDYNTDIRTGNKAIDDIDLPPAAKEWLKRNEIVDEKYVPVPGGGARKVVTKRNTPEQMALIKDYITNSKEGQRYAQAHKEWIEGLENEINPLLSQIEDIREKSQRSKEAYAKQNNISTWALKSTNYRNDALLDKASNLLKNTKLMMSANREGGGFKKGLHLTDEDLKELAVLTESFYNDKVLNQVIDKYQKDPNSLSKEENVIIQAKYIADQISAGVDPGSWYNIGATTKQSLPFMRDFILTAPIGGGVASGVKGGLSALAGKTGANLLLSRGIGGTVSNLAKGAIDLTVRPSVQTMFSPSSYAMAYQEMQGQAVDRDEQGNIQFDNRKTAGHGLTSAFIENQSEVMGEVVLDKLFQKLRIPLPAFMKTNAAKRLSHLTGIQNPITEYAEEKYSDLANIVRGEQTIEGFFDPRSNLETFGAVAIMQIPFSAINNTGYGIGKIKDVQAKRAMRKAYETSLSNLNNILGQDAAQLLPTLNDVVENRSDVEIQEFLLGIVEDQDISDEKKRSIGEYVTAYSAYSGVNKAKTEQVEEATQEILAMVEDNVNPEMGAVVSATIVGMDTPVQIAGGNVVQNEDGTINREQSDKEIYYTDAEGKRQVTSINYIENITENIPTQDAIAQVTEQVVAPIIAQQENEEVRPYQAGETVRFSPDGNTSLIGQIEGQDQATGNYILSVETPNGIQQMQVQPRQIINEDNLEGVENGSPVIYTNQNGEQVQDVVATTPDLYAQGLIGFENGDVVPVTNVIGLTGNNEQISQSDNVPISDNMQGATQQNEGTVSAEQSDVQPNEPRIFEIEKGLSAVENADGTYSLNKQFTKSELKKADNLINRLNEDYSDNGLIFEIIQLPKQDASNPFEKPLWGISAKMRQQEQVAPDTDREETPSQNRENEHLWNIAENSDNPIDIASAYNEAMKSAGEERLLEWQKELLGRKVNRTSFEMFGDRNWINGAIARSWFNRKGEESTNGSIDVIAQELNTDVQSIVEFIVDHPSNRVKRGNDLTQALNARFKEIAQGITGREVGGVDSNSGRLLLSTLEYAVKNTSTEAEATFMQSDAVSNIPNAVEFFLSDYMRLDEMDDFDQFRSAVEEADRQGYFIFPLETKDKETILNYINNAEQQANAVQGLTENVLGQQPSENGESPTLEEKITKAEAETDTNPTEAQKEAGNYKKGKVSIQGLDISIEQPRGSVRSGTDQNGKEWSIEMQNTYGYIGKTKSKDGDHIDVFLGNNPENPVLFVVDQMNLDGSFDEHKVMLGFDSIEQAREAYLSNYEEGWQGLGNITQTDIDTFKKWAKSDTRKVKPFAEYKEIQENPYAASNQDYVEFTTKPPMNDTEVRNEYLRADLERELSSTNVPPMAMNELRSRFGLEQNIGTQLTPNQKELVDNAEKSILKKLGRKYPELKASQSKEMLSEVKKRKKDGKYIVKLDRRMSKTPLVLMARRALQYNGKWEKASNSVVFDNESDAKAFRENERSLGEGTHFQSSTNIFKPVNEQTFNSLVDRLRQTGLARDVVTDKVAFDAKLDEVINDNATAKQVLSEMDTIKQEAIANGTFMLAPNGEPTKLNENQWLQVRTKPFLIWFGDWINNPEAASKVMDENGEPMVVYHATQSNFDSFSKRSMGKAIDQGTLGSGFYFTSSSENASVYTQNLHTNTGKRGGESIMPVFLSIKNPYDAQLLFEVSGDNKKESQNFTDKKKRQGYDGAKFEHRYDFAWFVAYEPTQIKSAISNNGEFDSRNPDIRMQVIGIEGASNLDISEDTAKRINNFSVAEEMEKADKDAKTIRLATGWERGADGKWRYEIGDLELSKNTLRDLYLLRKQEEADFDEAESITYRKLENDNYDISIKKKNAVSTRDFLALNNVDYQTVKDLVGNRVASSMRYNEGVDGYIGNLEEAKTIHKDFRLNRYNGTPLSFLLDFNNPILKAYPQLKDIIVSYDNRLGFKNLGGYVDGHILLSTSMPTSWTDRVLTHEIQHAIQDIEGFAKGGRVNRDIETNEGDEYIYDTKEAKAIQNARKEYKNTELGKKIESASDSELIVLLSQRSRDPEWKAIIVAENLFYDKYKISSAQFLESYPTFESYSTDKYKRLAGEVEARNAEIRRSLNDNERLEKLLSETEDTTREDQIVQFMRANMGDVYGFVTPDGTVYLDSTRMNANTPIHEFGHLWNSFTKENNAELYNRGAELVKESEYWQRVNDNPSYSDLSDESKVDEALAMAIGDKGEAIVNRNLKQRFVDWLSDVWKSIKKVFGFKSDVVIEDMTLSDFTDLATKQLLGGEKLVNTENYNTFETNESKRKQQNEISLGGSEKELRKVNEGDRLSDIASRLRDMSTGNVAELERLHERSDREKRIAFDFAKENNLWVDDLYDLGLPYQGGGNENTLALNTENGKLYKSNNLLNSDFLISKLIEQTQLHNALFPNTKYTLEGFTGFENGNSAPFVEVILSQNFIPNTQQASIEEIEDYMSSLGFKKMTDSSFTNGDITVSDLHPRNVLKSKQGNIYVIDDIIRKNNVPPIRFQSVNDVAAAADSTMTEDMRNELDKRIKNLWFRIREAYEDRYLAVQKFLDVLRENGTEVAEHNDFYKKATHINGAIDAQLEQYNNKYQKPLNKAIYELEKAGFDYRDIENYAILKHGLERNKWMKEDAVNQYMANNPEATPEQIGRFELKLPNDFSGITAVEKEVGKHAEWFINDFEEKAGKDLIDNLWRRVKDATSYSLNKQLEGQLIDKKTVEDLISRYDYYVPLRGHDAEVAEDRWDYSPDMGTYFVAPLLKAKGRKTRSESPFAYIASMAQSTINSANRNILNQTILRLAIKDKTKLLDVNKAWYEKTGEQDGKPVYEVRSPEYNEDPETYRKNIEEFEERMTKLAEAGLAVQSGKKLDIGGLFIKRKQADQHEVHVFQNGTEYVVYINANPAVARAINGSNAKDLHKDLRFFARVSRQMAANFTTRNPIFVASNFSRDYIFSSSILPVKENAKYALQFQRNMIPSADALQRYVRGKADLNKQQDRYLNEYILNGAKTGFSHILELQKVQKQIERDIKKGKGRNVFRNLLDGLEGMNEFAENLSRLSVYITSRKQGRSITQSVSDAKEVTVNFNRSGAGGLGAAWFRSLYLFINAGIQALSNFAKIALKNKAKTAMLISSYAMSGFLMPMLTALIGGDDGLDDYLKLSDWERQNNLCIYTGNGFIKIPLPHELRVFHKMGDEIYQSLFGKKDVTQSLLDTTLGFSDLIPANPLGAVEGSWADIMPDATKPFFQLAANRNYTGSRITNEWTDPNKPGYLRVRTNKKGEPFAPAFLVKLAETLDNATGGDGVERGFVSFNPDAVNHLMRGYFGGLYNMGMQGLDIASKTYDWTNDGEFKLKVRETPLKTFYTSESDLQTSGSGLNTKYFKVVNDTQETMRKLKGYEDQVGEGKLSVDGFAKKIENLNIQKANELYERIKQIKKYESTLKELDGQDQKDLEKIISDLKKGVIEVNNKLSE